MRIIIIGLLILIAIIAGGLFVLGQKSKSGVAPGLTEGRLTPCPDSPNCVTSEAGADESHAVAPLPADSWSGLGDIIGAMGGKIIVQNGTYIASEFTSSAMGFVDDVEFRLAEEGVHVRSASRVGRSDFGVNRKRVEEIRTRISQTSP